MTRTLSSPLTVPGVAIRRSTAADWGDVTAFLIRYREDSQRSVLSPDHPTSSVEIPATRDEPGGMLLAEWYDAGSGNPAIVGLVSWKSLGPRRPRRAGASLVLAGGWAARGVGSALLAAAAAEARQHAMVAFVAPVIPRNGVLRAAAREAGLRERRRKSRIRDEVEILLERNGA